MAEQEQVSKRSDSLKARVHIAGYISAIIFLYIEGGRLSNVLIQAVSILFLVPALLILIAQFPVAMILKRAARYADDVSSFPMYLIVLAVFVNEVLDLVNFTQRVELLWVIPVVLLAIIVYDVFNIAKGTREMVRSIGRKSTAIIQLKILSFILIYFIIVVLAFDIQGFGNPIFWLAPALISLTIALFLDGTFKK